MDADIQHGQSGHTGHAHDPHLQHHFGSLSQQFDSGKLGMWLFLATEVLLFGGLFCAYSVYRANHPEVFIYAHQFLDKFWGGVNTCVLLISSLTMAWAVRCSQLGKKTGLIVLLAITLLCGFGFLGIKFVEYKAKWQHGLLWGKEYKPTLHEDSHEGGLAEAGTVQPASVPALTPAMLAGADTGSPTPTVIMTTPEGVVVERSKILPAALAPDGLAPEGSGHEIHGNEPRNVQTFFSVYFLMTGLHGLHVIAGMACIGWVLRRALKGEFGPSYFTPVDLVGLYWHLVDLIWIYLFPLLYLIH
jgi:cytochrome c oxidase subunit III